MYCLCKCQGNKILSVRAFSFRELLVVSSVFTKAYRVYFVVHGWRFGRLGLGIIKKKKYVTSTNTNILEVILIPIDYFIQYLSYELKNLFV